MALFYRHIMAAAGLAAVLVLGGCGGGGGGGPVVDMSVISGAGTMADPFAMPATVPADTDGGMEDWQAAGAGVWEIQVSCCNAVNVGADIEFTSLKYDSVNDIWTVPVVSIGGDPAPVSSIPVIGDFELSNNTGAEVMYGEAGWDWGVQLGGGGQSEAYLLRVIDDDPTAAQYGTFAIMNASIVDATLGTITNYKAFYMGLRTDPANMPAVGTATYDARYEVLHIFTSYDPDAVYLATGGRMELAADFGANTFSTNTIAPATFSSLSNRTIAVELTGAISGNQITGAASGTYWVAENDTTHLFTGGSFDAGFFGPAADEIAGSFNLGANADWGPTVSFIGGFWGAKR